MKKVVSFFWKCVGCENACKFWKNVFRQCVALYFLTNDVLGEICPQPNF